MIPLELTVVVPAYNEATTVGGVIDGHAAAARSLGIPFEIVASDDGSTDATWTVLEAARDRVPELRLVRNETNRGIPETMKRLYAEAHGAWVYFTPGDGQVPADALSIMWRAREGAALVVGRRVPRRDPSTRILMAQLYSAALRTIFRLSVHDIDSVKLYLVAEQRTLNVRSASTFFEAEMLIALTRRRRTIREVVIPHRPRIAGRPKGVTPLGLLGAMNDLGRFVLSDIVRGRVR
jgi:glycosyltransferase involved in cell wall biosynthesis